jgi:diguanylate cyclase (GGDEF)-like protein
MKTASSLYRKRVLGLSLQGDLQYATEQSRKAYLSILAGSGRDKRSEYIARIHNADLQIRALTGKSLSLRLDPGEMEPVVREFESNWKSYAEARDAAVALTLQGRLPEALTLERTNVAGAFEAASATLTTLKWEMEAAAAAESQSIGQSFGHTAIELTGLTVAMILFIARLVVINIRERNLMVQLERQHEKLEFAETLESKRSEVLEKVGRNEPLNAVLEDIVSLMSHHQPDCTCAVALLKAGRLQLATGYNTSAELEADLEGAGVSHGTSASGATPPSIHAHADGTSAAIGAEVISNCEAVFRKHQQWARVRPIVSSGGRMLGIVAVGRTGSQAETEDEAKALEVARRLAAIATEKQQLYEELAFQAKHDVLTGLPNRSVFQDRVQIAIAEAATSGLRAAVLRLDLDRFQHVNDAHGHGAGDMLLRAVAQRLRSCVGPQDTSARIGSDEFTVALTGLAGAQDAVDCAHRILETLQAPFQVQNAQLTITVSIGLSVYPEHGGDVVTLERNADAALYSAKRSGRNSCAVFAPELARVSKEDLEIEHALSQALEQDELHLVYQPQLDATGAIDGAEALLRWKSAKLGPVPPGRFIPIAEQCGLILPIGTWVLNQACRQAASWAAAGHPLRVAVNVSAIQFSGSDFAKLVAETLQATRLDPALLELELTETAVMSNVNHASAQMIRLRNLGVSISVDDFGTGYCSLAYLQQLPVNTLKLDQSFVRKVDIDTTESGAVLEAILTMAHSLNLRTVAEGVETEYQFDFLKRTGCELFQGFLFHRPMSPTALETLMSGRATDSDLAALAGVLEPRGQQLPLAAA